MTSTFRFELGSPGFAMATRPNGQELLDAIERVMGTAEVVELDFAERSPTPSFVDQCIGGFVRSHGLEAFKAKIRLVNVAEDDKPLIRHVVLSRASQRAMPPRPSTAKSHQGGFLGSDLAHA